MSVGLVQALLGQPTHTEAYLNLDEWIKATTRLASDHYNCNIVVASIFNSQQSALNLGSLHAKQ